jgi:hypothetical protein
MLSESMGPKVFVYQATVSKLILLSKIEYG